MVRYYLATPHFLKDFDEFYHPENVLVHRADPE